MNFGVALKLRSSTVKIKPGKAGNEWTEPSTRGSGGGTQGVRPSRTGHATVTQENMWPSKESAVAGG